ncbi:DUF998 domain-containing protein [Streptomyces carpaticus]|uniref:DUF998 domain-containing protein n=1 Tax=Streptomyces carpaticus TaxID=285558 RepID=A0ABV4ZI88_9ACTN
MTGLLWVGALGCWLFVVTFLIDGWTRPGYSPVRHPVSALALGDRGWVQKTNFIACGLAITAGAAALPGAVDSVLLAVVVAVFGLSLVASGVYPMDPMRGYPPGTPEGDPPRFSKAHERHDWAGFAVFGLLPVAAVTAVFVLPGTGWKVYAALTALVAVVSMARFSQAWESDDPRTGLIQRVFIVTGWLWLGIVFAHAAR